MTTISYILLLAIYSCLVFMLLFFEKKRYVDKSGTGAAIFKITASLCFVTAAFLQGSCTAKGGMWLMIALILCFSGDIFLIAQDTALFRIGLFSFLSAHIAYCIFFCFQGVNWLVALSMFPLLFAAGLFLWKWFHSHLKKGMRLPVAAYVAVICTMVVLSAGTSWNEKSWSFVLCATAFMISDIFVAKDRFVRSNYKNRLLSLPLYYTAQMGFASLGHLHS